VAAAVAAAVEAARERRNAGTPGQQLLALATVGASFFLCFSSWIALETLIVERHRSRGR
jgi:hypothetical protein